jgi:hypothetical protein
MSRERQRIVAAAVPYRNRKWSWEWAKHVHALCGGFRLSSGVADNTDFSTSRGILRDCLCHFRLCSLVAKIFYHRACQKRVNCMMSCASALGKSASRQKFMAKKFAKNMRHQQGLRQGAIDLILCKPPQRCYIQKEREPRTHRWFPKNNK